MCRKEGFKSHSPYSFQGSALPWGMLACLVFNAAGRIQPPIILLLAGFVFGSSFSEMLLRHPESRPAEKDAFRTTVDHLLLLLDRLALIPGQEKPGAKAPFPPSLWEMGMRATSDLFHSKK